MRNETNIKDHSSIVDTFPRLDPAAAGIGINFFYTFSDNLYGVS